MKHCYLISGLMIATLLFAGCTDAPDANKADMFEFTAGPCMKTLGKYSTSDMGVKDIVWLDKNTTAQIKVDIAINCDQNIKKGEYRLEGDNITLKYTITACGTNCGACICVHELYYKIKNMEKKEYNIVLTTETSSDIKII